MHIYPSQNLSMLPGNNGQQSSMLASLAAAMGPTQMGLSGLGPLAAGGNTGLLYNPGIGGNNSSQQIALAAQMIVLQQNLQALQAQQALQQAQETVGLQQAMAALNIPIAISAGNLSFDGPTNVVGMGGGGGGGRAYAGGGFGGGSGMLGDGLYGGGYGHLK